MSAPLLSGQPRYGGEIASGGPVIRGRCSSCGRMVSTYLGPGPERRVLLYGHMALLPMSRVRCPGSYKPATEGHV